MKSYNKYCLIIILVLFSCKNNKPTNITENDKTITVSLDMNANQEIDISELIDSIRFIKLETADECLIAEIQKIIFYDGLYYIQDNKAGSLFVFDESGKFQFKVCEKGQGPGEYVQITHLLLDYNNKQILIYDVTTRKMIFYTLDGKFIKNINGFSSNAVIRDLILLPDGYFLCYTPDYQEGVEYCNGVWRVSPAGKPENFLLKPSIHYPINFHFHINYFYELPDNEVGLWCPDVNDIFRLSNNSVYKYLSMEVNMNSIVDFPYVNKKNLPSGVMLKTNVIEKDNFILTDWWNGERFYKTSVYLKKENKTIVGGISFETDIAIPGIDVCFNRTDQLLQVIYAHNAQRFIESEHYTSEKNKAILQSMFNRPEDDNPVLEILYLKK